MQKRFIPLGLLLFILLGRVVSAQPLGASQKVFQVGIFDGASNEFRSGQPSGPVDINADSANAAAYWYRTQPALNPGSAADAGTVEATAPRNIDFKIDGRPAAAYRLRIALLIESRSLPALRICMDGKCGMFFLDSPLDATLGDSDDTFESVLAPAMVNFSFPGRDLHTGRNVVALQVIGDGDGVKAGASLTYDAIDLQSVPPSQLSPQARAAVVPTVFYYGPADNLQELIDVYVHSGTGFDRGGQLDLIVDGRHYRQRLKAGAAFGEQEVEFRVPEFIADTTAELDWTIGDHRHHATFRITPRRKWTLLVVPHIHLDVGYSDYQSKVAAIQAQAIDEGIDFAKRYPGFCYTMDGSWALDQFMKTRTPADQRRAIAAMKNGRLFAPAEYAELLTGFASTEALIRSLYFSANFSRLHGTPFNYANITDVPSYSWSYPSILAAAGIHYLIAGPNGHLTRAPVLIQGRLNEDSPFWWKGPDGSKVLFWYARHYWEAGILFGVPPHMNAGRATVPLFLKAYQRPSYHANAVIVYGTQQENTDLFPQQARLAAEWNSHYAYPRIQYSGFYSALKEIAAQFHGKFPTVSGDGGPYWEDGIASNARYAAMERRNESRALSAEKLATLTSLVNPRLAADKSDLDRMWKDIVLMDEHTWNSHDSYHDMGSDENIHQQRAKELYAIDARRLGFFIAHNSMASLAHSIPVGRGNLIVFNTLNWMRSGLVTMDIPRGREIIDSTTGSVVPFEILRRQKDVFHVRFMAPSIPAFGYKVFRLRRSPLPPPPQTEQGTTLQSPYYRVVLDPYTGAIRSIYDKQLHRELVNKQSPYRFGQYLYVSGGDRRPNTLLQYRTVRLEPQLTITGAHAGRLLSVTRTPWGWDARMQSTDTNTPTITTDIRLFDKEKKIEIVDNIDKIAVRSREAVYFAFPFAMNHPEFRYEIQTGVVDPAKDMYPGAGHEWFSVQHWVSVQQDHLSAAVMPMDASLVTLGDIDRGAWPAAFGKRPGTIFSYVMNNYWSTNYNAEQGGHMRFRYVITSSVATNDASLSRMGWEEATPLCVDTVTHQDRAVTPPPGLSSRQRSYLSLNDPDLLVEDWKPAEDGVGSIMRFLDLGGTTRRISVRMPSFDLERVLETDAVERNLYPLPQDSPHNFHFEIHPHQIVTVRVETKPGGTQVP